MANEKNSIFCELSKLSNTDAIIKGIAIADNGLNITVEAWDGAEKILSLDEYYAFKEVSAVGSEIGDIVFAENYFMLNEVKKNIIEGKGSKAEADSIASCIVKDGWNERVVFEIITYRKFFQGFN